MSEPAQNTDRELWRERPGDYYADSLHVTEGGGIGINCGGLVFVMPIRTWHALAKAQQPPTPGDAVHPGVRAVAAGAGDDPPIQRRDAMTMRVMIKNADETGRLAVVLVEERGALEHDWKYLDRVYLKQSEERAFFIHAASRLTVTEDPSATVARP